MTKKNSDWTDHLGESGLPADEFTFTDGSNFGLDGYDFYTPPNEGVEQGARLPEAKGLAGLPDGIVEGGSEDDDSFFMESSSEGGEGLYLDGVFEDGAMPTPTDHDGTLLGSMLSEDEGALPMTPQEKQAASLADLQWLDPTQKQDPDRLPKELLPDRPPLDSSPELEDAWGVDRRTDGINIIPNVTDREVAQYNESIKEGPESGLPQPASKTAEEVKDAILWAMRQSHYGADMLDIKRGLVRQLGHDARRTVKAVEIIEREHGLAGKVFVRANAFPGLKNGKWSKELKKIARTAHYVITDDDTVGKKLGMAAVSEVPWDSALSYYREWLGLAGYKVASEGDPKTILREAFLRGPEEKQHDPTPKPVVKPVVATEKEATEALGQAATPPTTVQGSEDKAIDKRRKAALVKLAKWVKEDLLTQAEAQEIRQSGGTPAVMLKAAARLMQARQNKQASYAGTGEGVAQAQAERESAGASLDEREAEVTKREAGKLQKYLNRAINAGLLTSEEVGRILAINKPPAELMRLAGAAVKIGEQRRQEKLATEEAGEYDGAGAVAKPEGNLDRNARGNIVDNRAKELRDAALGHLNKLVKAGKIQKIEAEKIRKACETPEQMYAAAEQLMHDRQLAQKGDYEGQHFEAAGQSRPAPKVLDDRTDRIAALAKKSGQKVAEIQGLLNWSRRLMSEGTAGVELDQMLKARFSGPLLKAAAPVIKEAREIHEGLAGFLYVDAEAYASPSGVKGCKKGALKHRANGLKFVMAMDRCASCTQKNADGYCAKYNKKLVDAPPVADVKAYQERSIKLSEAPDHEVTASLFDPSEFALQSQLDGEVELEEDASAEVLSDILFGGTEL